MTIERGGAWGRAAPLADGAPLVASDAELRAHVEAHRRRGTVIGPVGLVGGDLWTTLGAPVGGVARVHGDEARTVPVDVVSVLLDGRQFWFVSHLVARRSWWFGRVLVAMNGEWLGDWDLGPRAHPDDGLVDVYDTSMAFGERLKARSRLRTGSHLPHPEIAHRRCRAGQWTFDPARDVWLDGTRVGRVGEVALRVEPDAMEITF